MVDTEAMNNEALSTCLEKLDLAWTHKDRWTLLEAEETLAMFCVCSLKTKDVSIEELAVNCDMANLKFYNDPHFIGMIEKMLIDRFEIYALHLDDASEQAYRSEYIDPMHSFVNKLNAIAQHSQF